MSSLLGGGNNLAQQGIAGMSSMFGSGAAGSAAADGAATGAEAGGMGDALLALL
jgi:hypothetical protein